VQAVRGGYKWQKPPTAEHSLSRCSKGVLAYAGVHIAYEPIVITSTRVFPGRNGWPIARGYRR
jgi:hypothetical protein